MNENLRQRILTKVVDTAVVSGVGVIVMTLAGSALTFIWTGVVSMDSKIAAAVAGVEATQRVTAEELTKLQEQIQLLTKQIEASRPRSASPASTATSAAEPPAFVPSPIFEKYREEQRAIQSR